jgi:hypothetical protein
MGNGFVKCTVVAYGRVNTTGTVESTYEPRQVAEDIFIRTRFTGTQNAQNITRIIRSTDVIEIKTIAGYAEIVTQKFVIAPNESILGDNKIFLENPILAATNKGIIPKAYNENGIEIKYPIVKNFGTGRTYGYIYSPSIDDPLATFTLELLGEENLRGELRIASIIKNYQTTGFGFFKEALVTYAPGFFLTRTF